MALTEESRKEQLIGQVAGLVKRGKDKVASDMAEEFIRQFYEHVPPDDILTTDPRDLHGAAQSIWKLSRQRRAEETLVRVLNPDGRKDGWSSRHTVVEVINDDMPFLVDSVTAELNRQGHTVHLVIHPIAKVRRNARGRLMELLPPETGPNGVVSESYMHIQIDELRDPAALREVHDGLERVLADVRFAVTDWQAMRAKVDETIARLDLHPPRQIPYEEIIEGRAFLQWANDNHFTFLGYREYETIGKGSAARMVPKADAGLGVLRDPAVHVFEGVRQLNKLPKEVRAFLRMPRLLIINKANMKSTVHRAVHMDAVGVKMFSKSGRVVGERLFVGLFTSAAYNRIPRDIPLLRRKVDITIARSGFRPNSHDGKALLHILETLPRDELFQMSEDELFKISLGILHLQERQRVSLFCREDNFQRFVSCLVYIPREKYSTEMRRRFQAILEEVFAGPVSAFDTQIAKDSVLGRVHYIVKTRPGEIPAYDVLEIEKRLIDAARSWTDGLRETMVRELGEEAGLRLSRRYGEGFPTAYRETFDAKAAMLDIEMIRGALAKQCLGINLYRPADAAAGEIRLKIYNCATPVPLSDILPILENMGLKVISEVPYKVPLVAEEQRIWIHDFELATEDSLDLDLDAVREDFQEALARVWTGDMEDDGFNRLVLGAGLSWREVVGLRAACKYLRQAGITFSQAYMEETLADNPGIVRLIVELFQARFDPDSFKGSARRMVEVRNQIEAELEHVASLDQDRILRRFVNLVECALRTNFFQHAADGGPKPYVAFKLDSRNIDELPAPRPFREIFVYSPRVEGVHLRFGLVARGGLRWSDRREDFRTEILGLVKAQQVKNAVIVPVGSKGGFVVKRPPPAGDREAFLNEGIACYKTFISGLLDVTDNLDGATVVAPPRVIRQDQDDPYLVVAADKGTATFSDIANGVSADYGFWLDDAFASGGSAGYDHKKMGITARGAWESVKRHFREMGHDTQSQDFTVIGVGDMAGDVFGNGMLLSKHIKLIGAFNHMHIFVDPDPDPAASWDERKRLFDTPRSTWADYDAKLISTGGGVFERSAKSVQLSPEIKRLFGLTRDSMTPNELIKAMLKAEIDLLWFGGIGTYVKSRRESQADAGDRANDALRIDGRELGAKVVGEGANLGVTQLGRIEYALAGGRINTDALDNSAGVDCSDHEVNIKILMRSVMAEGDMSRRQRDRLLEEMTDEVAELVLEDNYLQTQSISVTEQFGVHMLDRLVLFMRALERQGLLDRALEFLPDDEALVDRKNDGLGLTRPEMSVLLAYAKIALYDDLLPSDLPDARFLEEALRNYFPTPLREKYAKQIADHRLRREIIATVVTNDIVNRVGITFMHEVMEKTGMGAGDVARAYFICREIFGMSELWAEIEALDNKAPAEVQANMLIDCGRLIERSTVWFLRQGPHPLSIVENVGAYGPSVRQLMSNLDAVLTESHLKMLGERTAGFIEQGAPEALARRIASAAFLVPACDVVRIAAGAGTPVEQAARIYFAIGSRFGFDWLRRAAATLQINTHWDKQAVAAIVDDLYSEQYEIAVKVLDAFPGARAGEDAILTWAESRGPLFQRTERLFEDMRAAPAPLDLSMLAVANRQLRALVTT
ncbi:MAG: NAD-glutamate dehydrogenase [Alphaproteobacteria bacterium]|nr:NAD-glutamate dehydrogenase [Alphaproteobacteria bacterium]